MIKGSADKLTPVVDCYFSLVPRPLPREERAWYPLHAHALDFRGGVVYTRHSQTREWVVTKRSTITIIGGETNKTELAVLPTLPSLGPTTNGKTSLSRIPWEARRRRLGHDRWSILPFFALA